MPTFLLKKQVIEIASPVVQAKQKAAYPVNPVVQRGQDPELFWLDKYGTAN